MTQHVPCWRLVALRLYLPVSISIRRLLPLKTQFQTAGLLIGAILCVVLITVFLVSQNPVGLAREDKAARKSVPSPANQKQKAPALEDVALARELDRIIDESNLQARWGVFVMSQKDGRVLYARDADKSFTPASNMKIYTTAVALDLLGGDYRWRTSVYAQEPADVNGVIDGDLILYGRGAPDLLSRTKGESPSLEKLADQLYQSGIRHVRGGIVGDNSYFRGDLFGLGWQWNDLQWYFGAEPSALSVDENSVEVTISPAGKKGESANVVVTPNQNFVRLTNNASTGEQHAITTIGIIRNLSDNDIRVWGDFPVGGHAFSAFLSVHDPALWAGALFKQALTARGITVDGKTRSRDFRTAEPEKFDPLKAIELASQDSQSLGEIVRRTNKESNNLFAELILRAVGKDRGTSVPDSDPRKNATRGDDEAGAAVIRQWLESKAITTKSVAIHDGSGLSRLDLVTPEATGRLLLAMTNSKAAALFHDSLPIAGQDGTLTSRLKKIKGRIFAKTGTLTYTHSLSGYATSQDSQILVFSIVCNDAISDRGAAAVVDDIATAIADSRAVHPAN